MRLALPALLMIGCEGVFPSPDLERMKEQPSFRPFEPAPWFADGRAMQAPPPHTVPYVNGENAPVKVDRELLQRGRGRFEIYCAACHGRRGDGRSEVARNMELRKPPSLLSDEVRRFSDERIFFVASLGWGLMPSYAAELTTDERWAVVAYVRALQLSQGVRADRLPPELRKALP